MGRLNMVMEFKNPDDVISEGIRTILDALPAGAPAAVRDELSRVRTYDELTSAIKSTTGVNDDDAKWNASAILYGMLDKSGVKPSDWFPSLVPLDKTKIKYGPEEYNKAVNFYGNWSTVQWLAVFGITIAALWFSTAGLVIAVGIYRAIRTAMLAGKAVSEILAIGQIQKLLALPKLLIPSLLAGVSTILYWASGTQILATGDLNTYVLQNLARSVEEQTKTQQRAADATAKKVSPAATGDRFIIRMAQTSKPQVFTGILFSAPLSKPEAFERHLDDEITDLDDLSNDLKLNLANWMKGLAGRISVAIAVRNNPIISKSEILNGTWLVASLSYNLVDGARVFLDTIPLGPINPVKYMPRVQEVKTLEQQIAGEFKPETVKELVIPPSALQVLTKEGEIVPILPQTAPVAPLAPPAPTPAVTAPVVVPAPSGGPFGYTPGTRVKVSTGGDNLNMRDLPNLSGTILRRIPNGTQLTVTRFEKEADGYSWYVVLFQDIFGFVAGQYLKPV